MAKNSKKKSFVVTKTPLRISFVGGGTDLPDFFNNYGGSVISTTIDKYIYVTAKRHNMIFNEKFRISYSQTELKNSVNEIENRIARECIKYVGIEPPLYISTISDLPAKSGLGSSSSFAVGLLNALYALEGKNIDPNLLAEQACEIEINILNQKIGKQDQYAAAFGGFNHINFSRDTISVDKIDLDETEMDLLFSHFILVWTKIERDANSILLKQNSTISKNLKNYYGMKDYVSRFKSTLYDIDVDTIANLARLLEESFQLKKELHSDIITPLISDMHSRIKQVGGMGGKLCGAGGGGFLLEVINPKLQSQLKNLYPDLSIQNIKYEQNGSCILVID